MKIFMTHEGLVSLVEEIEKAAIEVFNELGSGHSEIVYEAALEIELSLRNLEPIRRQVPCPIYYKEYPVGFGQIDTMVKNHVVLELKSSGKLSSKDETQLRKYMDSAGLKVGLLINFNPILNEPEIIEQWAERL